MYGCVYVLQKLVSGKIAGFLLSLAFGSSEMPCRVGK